MHQPSLIIPNTETHALIFKGIVRRSFIEAGFHEVRKPGQCFACHTEQSEPSQLVEPRKPKR